MILHLIVKPNSKVDEIVRLPDGSLKIKIKAAPVDGKANQYLSVYLGKFFGIPKSKIVLTKGQSSSFKTIEIFAEDKLILEKLSRL